MPWPTLSRTTQLVSVSEPALSMYTPDELPPIAEKPLKVGAPAATYKPKLDALCTVTPLDDTVAAVAW